MALIWSCGGGDRRIPDLPRTFVWRFAAVWLEWCSTPFWRFRSCLAAEPVEHCLGNRLRSTTEKPEISPRFADVRFILRANINNPFSEALPLARLEQQLGRSSMSKQKRHVARKRHRIAARKVPYSLRGTGHARLTFESLESRQLLSVSAVISEFMALNHSTLKDADGDYSDWIEIHNTTAAPVSLGGWSLTDDATMLGKWHFPAVTLAADGYLTVFASGKNRSVAGSELHTNFQLNSDGEYLALVQADGSTIATQFAPFPRSARTFPMASRSNLRQPWWQAEPPRRRSSPPATLSDKRGPAVKRSMTPAGPPARRPWVTIRVRVPLPRGTGISMRRPERRPPTSPATAMTARSPTIPSGPAHPTADSLSMASTKLFPLRLTCPRVPTAFRSGSKQPRPIAACFKSPTAAWESTATIDCFI